MEISDLYTAPSHEDGAEMQVIGEDGVALDCYITVAGIDSRVWRKASLDGSRKLFKGDGDAIDISDESIARATLGWRGFESDGIEIAFSIENALSLYKNAPYISEQVDKFIANRSNFTRGKASK